MALYAPATMALFLVAVTTLAWMIDSWRTPHAVGQMPFPAPDEPRLSFSLLVPARHEEAVLAHTVRRLLRQDHPDFEVLVVVGDDDPGTAAVAHRLAAEDRRVRVVVDESVPKNKPKGLNTALPHCRGQIVGVFDAEDVVALTLLTHVDACFRAERAHVVQGGVQLMNYRSSWWSLRNCLEYFFWFSSRLHFHARNGFIPLGGNTVFVRTDLLRLAGGWDADCLAEDCELGIRLSTAGARVAVAYSPELATREETPPTLRGLVKQRTRWNQGYLQVLRRGAWRRLPGRGRRLMARYLLAMPYLQAFSGLLVPVSAVTALLLKAPVLFVLLTFLPLAPTLATLVVEVVGLAEFNRMFELGVRPRDYLKLVIGAVPYQLLLATAAVRAAVREFRGERGWEKTEHVGAHLDAAGRSPAAAAAPAGEDTLSVGGA
ncbi:glycosyltransferase [Streptacidiphilus griseoplanus]|uniref:glycosyltransferase n=1 Tax=Peterkaempfera griseoplana TaxID=66896 RepID=UPI0006E26D03|nr:glycosyltransferase [Peterkaempfera griseoplana]